MDLRSVVNLNIPSSHPHYPSLNSNSLSLKSISSTHLPNLSIYRNYSSPVVVVRATGKKNPNNSSSPGNGDHSAPEGDNLKGNNPSAQGNKSNKSLDLWREFRASLCLGEQAAIGSSDTHKQDNKTDGSSCLGQKWAHPLTSPETGCVLVATEKLDGDRNFERTVIFLLGYDRPHENPFGVIINRPLRKKIKQMDPTNRDLATIFADCPVHFGGPVEASMFLLKSSDKTKLLGFQQIIPGVCFGSRDRLEEAVALVKKGVLEPGDFRFLVGYAGWDINQLKGEIEKPLWHVAACSSELLFGDAENSSPGGLWGEILQQMGGHYSELSRKPKQDM